MHSITILIGRLGADPEIRYTPSGDAVANLSVATTYPVKRGDEWEEEVEWHKVAVWRQQAEFLAEHAQKGSLVFIEGYNKTERWEDNDGVTRYITKVIAKKARLLSWDKNTNAENRGTTPSEPHDPLPPPEDDVPF